MSKEAMKLALEDYLSREMPAGTVIGDPKWWAAKIANVMTGKAVAEVYKQGYDHGVERQEAIQKLSEIEKQTPASKNQWWAKELEGFWGDSDYRVTLDTRRAAKTALTVIFDNSQPKQEQGEPVVGTKTWFEDGKVITQNLTAKDLYKDSEPAWTEMQCPICGDMAIPTPQPKQEQGEPVAWVVEEGEYSILIRHSEKFSGIFAGSEFRKRPLFYGDTTPQQRNPMTDAHLYLESLVDALDGAFISTWQSTAAWQTQLDEAKDYLAAHGIKE